MGQGPREILDAFICLPQEMYHGRTFGRWNRGLESGACVGFVA